MKEIKTEFLKTNRKEKKIEWEREWVREMAEAEVQKYIHTHAIDVFREQKE